MTSIKGPEIDIRIEAGPWDDIDKYARLCRSAIETATGMADLSMHPASEVGILLADDRFVRDLNRTHRGQDRPTNVLSFPLCEPGAGPIGPLLGDIVLAFETVQREAETQDTAFDHHVSHLVVHGFLHLFGYDHQHEQEAVIMETLETRVLDRLGIADPHGGAAA